MAREALGIFVETYCDTSPDSNIIRVPYYIMEAIIWAFRIHLFYPTLPARYPKPCY